MTAQEIFDTVLTKLRAQGVRSVVLNPSGMKRCAYQDGKGNKCAVGHLIPTGVYSPDMEGTEIPELLAYYRGLEFLELHEELLEDLQGAHDTDLSAGPSRWESAMAHIAQMYDLVYTPPNPVYQPTDEEGSTND